MELIDNKNKTLLDDLSVEIKKGSKLSIAAACFSIYAFQVLKEQLADIDEFRFRSCTNRLKPFQQSTQSSNNTSSLSRANRSLIIFGKSAGIVEPSQGTFNDPSLG